MHGGPPDQIPNGQRVFSGRHTDAYLNRHRAASGYTLVFWRGRHVADLTDLTEQEMCGYASELQLIARAIEAVYQPAKLNYLTLGNSLPHLYTHIVPRYVDDPGRPPRFMMVDQTWPPLPAAEYVRQLEGLGAAIRRLNGDG
jgi:diadenosine tetraphosphate (Ap4A) HIT family hydrolase